MDERIEKLMDVLLIPDNEIIPTKYGNKTRDGLFLVLKRILSE